MNRKPVSQNVSECFSTLLARVAHDALVRWALTLRSVRGVLALVAPSGALGRIAANERLQLNDVDEIVSLAAELICNHRGLARNC